MDGRTCQRDIDGVQAQHVKRSQADEEGKQDKGGYRNLWNEMHDLKKKGLVSSGQSTNYEWSTHIFFTY